VACTPGVSGETGDLMIELDARFERGAIPLTIDSSPVGYV
jgi:hypothetical protein